jgi:hypothetical protein
MCAALGIVATRLSDNRRAASSTRALRRDRIAFGAHDERRYAHREKLWNNDAIEALLDRRSKYSDVAAITALLARFKYLGAADDSAAYKGAL